ncbi:hypothetical protein V8F33_009096 [Rhypophila sp. PSN 637]
MPLVIYIACGVDRQLVALIVTFKVVAIVISIYTAALVIWDLVRDPRMSPACDDNRPRTQQRLGGGGHPSNRAHEFGKRAILTTRVMVFLGAVFVIIRSGAHIGFDFIRPPHRVHSDCTGCWGTPCRRLYDHTNSPILHQPRRCLLWIWLVCI